MRPRHYAIAATAAVLAFIGAGLATGYLGTLYAFIWQSVSTEPFTFTMRERPWLLPVFAVPLLSLLAWRLPTRLWARVLIMDAVALAAFTYGHVIWR